MMHSNNVVVAIRNSSTHKAFREFDHDKFDSTSQARVVIPFDTEYELLVRIQDFERRHIVATIDGAEAVSLILPPGESVIERFNDSLRKFKFVSASHAAVADPASPDNGKLQIRIYKETPWAYTIHGIQVAPFVLPDPYAGDPTKWPWPHSGGCWGGGFVDTVYSNAGYVHSPLRGTNDPGPVQCLYSCNTGAFTPPNTDTTKGATVEGGVSSVTYTGTSWRGDDQPSLLSFTFNLTGKTQEPQTGFCSECGSKLTQNAKFCHKCGKRV